MNCVLIATILLKTINSHMIYQPEQVKNDLLDCAMKYFELIQTDNLVIQTVQNNALEYLLKSVGSVTIINSDTMESVETAQYKFHSNIMIVEDEEEYERNIHVFYRTVSWNARARFLIVFTETVNVTHVFEFAWEVYILNIAILVTEDSKINWYTYFPYADEQCGNVSPKLIGSCDSSGIPTLNLYPPKVPANLHGCPIRSIAFYYQPYVINPYSSENPGLEIVMINEFGKAMNFTPVYVNHKLTHPGFKYAKGVYTKMFRMLYNYEGDIMFGSLKMNSSFNEEFDSSYTHLQDAICWYAPRAREVAPWKNLFIVFQTDVWFILFCLVCMTAVFWRFISHLLVVDQCYYSQILHCLTDVWHSLLLGSVRQPTGVTMRLSFISWVMCTFLISTVYQTMFTSILTNPAYGKQISNMEEMLESNLQYGFDPLAQGAFKFPQDKTLWTIYNNYVPCPFDQAIYCINRTVVSKNFVLAKNRKNMAYFLKNNYSYLGGSTAVYEFEAYTYHLRILVNQGFPLLERFNALILRAHACGLFMKWHNDLTQSLHQKQQDKTQIKKLTVEHLQPAFLILTLGCAIGVIVFIFELVLDKLK